MQMAVAVVQGVGGRLVNKQWRTDSSLNREFREG